LGNNLKKAMETGRLLKSVALRYRLPQGVGVSGRSIARARRIRPFGGIGVSFVVGRQQVAGREESLAQLEAVLF
jgi:hypothetical protein